MGSLTDLKKAGDVIRCVCETDHSSFSEESKFKREPVGREDNKSVIGPLQQVRADLRW